MDFNDSASEVRGREYGMSSSAGLRLKNNIKKMIEQMPPIFVQGTVRLLGLLRDAVRIAQYDVGPPFIYTQSIVLAPGAGNVFALNIPQDGTVRSFRWVVTNIGSDDTTPPSDFRMLAGVTNVGIASLSYFSAEDNEFVQWAGGPTSWGPGLNGVSAGNQPVNALAASLDGFARRIDVAKGTNWKVAVVNRSPSDRYQIVFLVEQYWRDRNA